MLRARGRTERPPSVAVGAAGRPMTVLMLIEDDARIRRSLETALAMRGFEVLTAATGLEGLRSVVEHHPAAVVLDLGLPDIDGLELVKMIRAVSEVPIVAATAATTKPSLCAPWTPGRTTTS